MRHTDNKTKASAWIWVDGQKITRITAPETRKLKGKFYECGICDCIHPWNWDDDCRDDANRLNLDDIADDAELVSWEDRQAADDERTIPAEKPTVNPYTAHPDSPLNTQTNELQLEKLQREQNWEAYQEALRLLNDLQAQAAQLAEALRGAMYLLQDYNHPVKLACFSDEARKALATYDNATH